MKPLPSIVSARVVVEHRLARLVQLGIRQSRYFGRIKTRFQLLLAATVANLTLVAAKTGMTGNTDRGPNALVTGIVDSAANASAAWARPNFDTHFARFGLTVQIFLPKKGFPARFLVANDEGNPAETY